MSSESKSAKPLPPMTDQEALKWVIGFARQEIEKLQSPGAWLDLSWNLARYAGSDLWDESSVDKDAIREIHAAVAGLLRDLSVEGGRYQGPDDLSLKHAWREAGRVRVGYVGAEPSNTVAVTMDLLARIDIRKLGQCTRCQQVFLGQRGQKYCGKQCANAVAAEFYRKRKSEQLRRKERERYQKKQQAKLGPKVIVGRKGG